MYYKSVSAIAGGGKTAVLLNTFSKGLARCSGSNWVFFPDPNWLCAPGANNFKPYVGRKRRSGTGCVSQINDHLFEGRYSPKWPDGKKHARNVYAHTREECEEKLKALIVEMKAEIAEAQRLKDMGEGDGRPPKNSHKCK